jgi:phosphoribosylformylglycinamidine synthase
MASKGGVGIELNLDHCPQRETGMNAYEAEAIFHKWGLDFAVIGETTTTGRLIVKHKGEVQADIPIPALADEAPVYERPHTLKAKPAVVVAESVPAPNAYGETLIKLMASPQLSSRRWIWEQYDHMVMADTVVRPGGDSAVVRLHGTNKGLAMTCDVTPRYCYADPFEGGKQAIAEAWRNLTASGAEPLAVTDCLNFGNPERPEIMGEFVGCLQGMGEACRALAFPVVSGNVSLYNETNGVAIPPTPGIGAIGLIDDLQHLAIIALAEGQTVLLLGAEGGHLGQSLFQEAATGKFDGAPPPVDLNAERRAGDLVRALIREGACRAVHDVSDGGLLVALAEMALAGEVGLTLDAYDGPLAAHALWFGEDQGRYILGIEAADVDSVTKRAAEAGLPLRVIGKAGGETINLPGEAPIALEQLRGAHESWFPAYFGENRPAAS